MGAAQRAAEGITSAMANHDMETARDWLTDDFTFHDPTAPQAMSADDWMGANALMIQAFPDLSYNFEILEEEGDSVWVRSAFSGTHQQDWDLSIMGGGILPATGKWVQTGRSISRGSIDENGKIYRIEIVEEEADAGMQSVFRQLGIQMG